MTSNALHCQTATAIEMLAQAADDVLAWKGNQGTFHTTVESFFAAVLNERTYGDQISPHKTVDGEQGRIEPRTSWHVQALEYLQAKFGWPGWQSLARVEARREINNRVSQENRY